MKHTIEHDIDLATAKRVTDRAFAEYRGRYPEYDPTLRWTGDMRADVSFSAKGIKLAGFVEIQVRSIVFDLDVPFVLRLFQKKAIEVIDREVRLWLGKAKSGQL